MYWGGGYPRPAYEADLQTHLKLNNEEDEDNRERQYIKVNGNLVFDLSTMQDARNLWARIDSRDLHSKRMSSEQMEEANEKSKYDRESRPIDDSMMSDANNNLNELT